MDDAKMDFVLELAYQFNNKVSLVKDSIVIAGKGFSAKQFLTECLNMDSVLFNGNVISVEEFIK